MSTPMRWLRRTLLGGGLALLLVVLGTVALVAWLLQRPAGTEWLLGQLPGVEVQAPQGSLLGEFRAERVRLHWAGGDVELQGLQWQGLGFGASGWGAERELRADNVHVQTLRIRTQPSSAPLAAPSDLRLPVGLRIEHLQVDRLDWHAQQPPVLGLQARVQLPRQGQHRIELHAARWQQLQLNGRATVDTDAPLNTQLSLQLQPTDAPRLPWAAEASATGPLARLQARVAVSAAQQSLQAQGELHPFLPWPVNALQVQAHQFDLAALAALVPGLPHTALTGEARLQAPSATADATLQAELTNSAPGRWDQGALPVQRLRLALAGHPDALARFQLTQLDADLLGGGSIQGRGSREADGRWQLQAQVARLRPEALDGRASPARLDGPVSVAGGPNDALSARLELAGTLDTRPLQLQAQVQGQGTQWQVTRARLASGDASLQAQGEVDTRGTVQLQAQLQQFDPHLLWRGAPGSAWARLPGPTRLNALARIDLRGQRLADLTGTVSAQLQPSQLAGLPLEGDARLSRERPEQPARFELDARLGKQRLQAQGEAQDGRVQSRVQVQAGALAELSPVLALLQAPALAGQADGDLQLQLLRTPASAGASTNAWQLASEGRLNLRELRARGQQLGQGQVQWALPAPGADGDGPVQLAMNLQQLRAPQARLDRVSLQLQGRRSDHELQLQAQGQTLQTAQPLTLDAQLQARGRWAGSSWTGKLSRVDLGPLRAQTPPLLTARDLTLRAALDGAPQVELQPGRAEVGGAVVRWDSLRWTGGAQPELRAELVLEDLAVAPLLARWQPEFGWGGDLRVGGHASVRVDDRANVELLLDRRGGDLRVTDELGQRPLGLTDLRLALTVQNGPDGRPVWRFAQGVAGAELGSLAAAVTLHPQGDWPDAQTPIEGVLQANVAQLATWGSWVPAGWRLGGRAAATVQLAGRLGAPNLTGQAEGEQLALRHLLYGVDVTEGRFALALKGQHAELTRLEARAGDGWLRAQGSAELGAQPRAQLSFTAERLRALSRVDRRLVVSGQGTLDLQADSLRLQGQLKADEGLVDFTRSDAPGLADDVTVLRGSRDTPAPTAPARPARHTDVQLALDFGNDFQVRGRGLATTLRGQLQIAQRDGPLRVTGKLTASGGQYAAYGQKLEIERGDIRFTGAYDNPALDLLAVRPNLDVRVGVRVGGTAQSPRVNLYSEPEMADTDRLAWLLLGRGPEGLGRTDTALLQRAALALLSGEGEGPTAKVLRNLGLDELSVAQTDDDTRATIVRLGKQLSRRWYVGYERSLNATTGSWQLIYRIAQRFTLRAQGGDDNALDLIWQWKWN
ncbi:translocation/assembly module TamB domain-containing protein [Roseateles sp. BYS87W]|uniref:Translocation/assembly module TamB domain-containing protein n=1 Tax=Pelomonas baiyunensis TaxID=3299026 RepID=A0ABW7GUN4_9BURK